MLYNIIMNKKYDVIVIGAGFAGATAAKVVSLPVTVGGVELDQLDTNFALKQNKHIFIVGEALNVDGICGGYNLRFAITSGFKATDSILNE